MRQRRQTLSPGTFLSRGKLDELKNLAQNGEMDLVVFDDDLSPAQVKNLEQKLECKILDRSELILAIFAEHARTRESRLQVELAQLEYLLPRLTRMWGHLSRQQGGIGTKGPGETQLEADRRRVREKIAFLKRKLQEVDRERQVQRARRSDVHRTALVGYTNAGKSTLLNALTGADVLVEDKLFATLDATVRRFRFPTGEVTLFTDTVGFIRKLPHHLVASFRSTLDEVVEADLLVHVVDASSPAAIQQIEAVGAGAGEPGRPRKAHGNGPKQDRRRGRCSLSRAFGHGERGRALFRHETRGSGRPSRRGPRRDQAVGRGPPGRRRRCKRQRQPPRRGIDSTGGFSEETS